MTVITITFPDQNTIFSYFKSHPETSHLYQSHKSFFATIANVFAETTETPKNVKEAVIWEAKKYISNWNEAECLYVSNTIAAVLAACAIANCQTRAEETCSRCKSRIISKL